MNDSDGRLPAATRLGTLSLRVRRREPLLRFYEQALGLSVHRHGPDATTLGCGGPDLLRLVEDPAGVEGGRHASLYHYCLAVERRGDLGWWLRRLLDAGVEPQGLVDHRMAEAIYLEDPEGNGIELNWDRPRSAWRPWAEWLAMGNAPLDIAGLMAADDALGPRDRLPSDTRVGHVHLHVGDLDACEAVYTKALGFDRTAAIPDAARFFAAGGYHHHVANNVWKGRGVAPQPPHAYGLESLSLVLPGTTDVAATVQRLRAHGVNVEEAGEETLFRDPSGHCVRLSASN